MKRSLYVSLLTIMYFSACQGSEELEQSQEKEYTVSIMARIGKTVSGARYLQDHENEDKLNWSRIKACLLIVGKKLNLCSAAKIIHS